VSYLYSANVGGRLLKTVLSDDNHSMFSLQITTCYGTQHHNLELINV